MFGEPSGSFLAVIKYWAGCEHINTIFSADIWIFFGWVWLGLISGVKAFRIWRRWLALEQVSLFWIPKFWNFLRGSLFLCSKVPNLGKIPPEYRWSSNFASDDTDVSVTALEMSKNTKGKSTYFKPTRGDLNDFWKIGRNRSQTQLYHQPWFTVPFSVYQFERNCD